MPTVFITGAKRGLGFGLASLYAAEGWEVIAAGRKASTHEGLNGLKTVRPIDMDVRDDDEIKAAIASLDGKPVDLLINNAGTFQRPQELDSLQPQQFIDELTINVIGPFLVSRALLPNLRAGQQKKIAIMSSQLGSLAGNGSPGMYAYRSSKAGVNGVMRGLSVDLEGEGFTVLSLHPGWVRTDMGGGNATLTIDESVRGLKAVLDSVDHERNGDFINYRGEALPW